MSQFGIKEVLNFTVQKFATAGYGGDIVFNVDYAKDTEVGTNGDRLNITGGQGNYQLLGFDHSKTSTFKATVPLVDLEMLAMLTGKPLATGITNVPKREVLAASASNTITLSATPTSGSLKIYKLLNSRDHGTEQLVGTPATTQDKYSITNATITLNATTAPETTKFVCYYDYSTTATARKVTVTANNFPQYMRITGYGLVTDEFNTNTYPIIFDVKKAKVKPGFTYTLASDKATEIPLEFDLYPVTAENGDKIYFETTVLPDAVV